MFQMTARVGAAPGHYPQFSQINTDPGVYEPECDWQEPPEPQSYPDTQQFLQQHYQDMSPPDQEPPPDQPPVIEQTLPLAGDYQGLGGPASVPLYTPAAFQPPSRPVERTILDEIFLEPTDKQLDAYYSGFDSSSSWILAGTQPPRLESADYGLYTVKSVLSRLCKHKYQPSRLAVFLPGRGHHCIGVVLLAMV